MLDLYKLHIFSVIVQEGSFRAAADRLYITQSAVSQHIKALESSLGRTLMERSWQGVKLTPHGERLYAYAKRLFDLVAEAENALTDVSQLADGRINIGTTLGISDFLAPGWVGIFRRQYPNLSVAIQSGAMADVVGSVLSGRIDIGFVEGMPEKRASLMITPISDIEQVVVSAAAHPLALRDVLDGKALDGQPFVVRSRESGLRQWLGETLAQAGIAPRISAEFDSIEAVKRALDAGMCISILPRYAVQAEIASGALREIPVSDFALSRPLVCLCDSSRHLSPLARTFLHILSEQYPLLKALEAQQ